MAINFNYKNIHKQDGNWSVSVNPRPGSDEMEVWLINVGTGKAQIANINKDGFLELKEIKEGSSLNEIPFMRVSRIVWQLLVDAITESTSPTKKEVVEAQLESVQYHLEDMRKLVFEDKTTIQLDSDYLCGHGSCLPGKCHYKQSLKSSSDSDYKEEIMKQKIEDILGDALKDGLREAHGDNDLAKKEQEEIVDRIIETMKGEINK